MHNLAQKPSVLSSPESGVARLRSDIAELLLQKLEQGTLELPILPEVSSQVIAMASDENGSAKALSDLIKRDASMAAHLLRVANSAYYAPAMQIASLQQAVSRLGLDTIRQIAIAISCKTRAFSVLGHQKAVDDLFAHSLGTALYAQEIARLRRANVEEAFLAGLLHDVGRPILLQALVDLHRDKQCKLDPAAIEPVLDAYHLTVGCALVEQWIPGGRLNEIIRYHHQPELAPNHRDAAALTRLADDLSHFTLQTRPIDEAAIRNHPMLTLLSLYATNLDHLLAQKERISAAARNTM